MVAMIQFWAEPSIYNDKYKSSIIFYYRQPDVTALERQKGLGEESSQQRQSCLTRIYRLGGWIHPGQRVAHLGPHFERRSGDFCSRKQGKFDAMAGKDGNCLLTHFIN